MRKKKGISFFILLGFTWSIIIFLVLPVIISMIGSFSLAWHKSIFGPFTLEWYRYVLDLYAPVIKMSLQIVLSCLIIDIIIGIPASYVLVKGDNKLTRLFEEILMMPIVVPGMAIAIALIQTHSFMRGYWYFILIGHVLFTLPFMVRTVSSTLRTFDFKVLEEEAASLGANFLNRFITIIIPNLKRAIITGTMMVFTISMGEFNLTLFLFTPLNMTLPVGLYECYVSNRIEIGSAFTAIYFILIIPVIVLAQYFGEERKEYIANQ
jgi:putative spermidine/putrescine transport system permease protein